MYIFHIFFAQTCTDSHASWCHILDTTNMTVQAYLSYVDFIPFGHTPRSGIFWSCGRSIFSFLRNSHTVLHTSSTNQHTFQESIRSLSLPQLHQHVAVFWLVDSSLFNWREMMAGLLELFAFPWWLNEIEHFFKCVYWPFVLCLEKMPLRFLAHFWTGLSGLLLNFWGTLYALSIDTSSDIYIYKLQNVFFPFWFWFSTKG